MERLTEIKTHVTGFSYADKKEGVFVQDVFAKLAAYEDTGLTPEQIQALAADKDEQAGRIMELDKALKCLHDLLEEHEPVWYLRKHHNIAIDALLGGKEDA